MNGLTIHRLRRTDSLETLSVAYRVPVCMIVRANGLDIATRLAECQELRIPRKCFCNRCAGVREEDSGSGRQGVDDADRP